MSFFTDKTKLFAITVSIFLFILVSLFASPQQVQAVWNGNLYQPGTTLNPECTPIQVNCNIVLPLSQSGSQSLSGALTIIPTTAAGLTQAPYGTASGSTSELRLLELAANGNNFVAFKSVDALTGDVVWTLPNADGTTGQVLSTSGTGALSWVNANTSKISTIHHSVTTVLAITPTHNNVEIHAENTGGFTIDGNVFTDDTFGTVILNTGGSSVTLTPSNFTGAFLRDGSSDVGFASLTIAADEAYSLTVTDNAGLKYLNVVTLGGGTKQWTTSGNNVYYSTGNVGIGTIAPGAELEVVGDIISTGTKWTERTAPSKEWNSVAYGNGLFVAITTEVTANRAMTSPDGINWTQRSATSTSSWSSVTYGKGLFVVVGYPGSGGVLGQVATSPDGINWTNRNAAIGNNWSYVTYANGKFVAVAASGTNNRVMTSVDGINWEIQTTPVDNSWAAVTYGNGLFVAVAQSGTSASVMTSPDGITWTSRSAFADEWRDITYAKGLFVAVARSYGLGNRIMTSPDGITWTSLPSPVINRWDAVTYGAGLFVILGAEGINDSSYITSPDGVTWTVREASASPFVTGRAWSSVVYANGMFVAVSNYGSKVMTSGFMDKNIVPDEVFTGGLTSLNGLTISSQTFATGKGGMDFNVLSVSGAHTFNLPDASLTSRGVLTTGLQYIAGDKNFANDLVVDGKLIAREAFLRSKDISFATAVNYPSAAAANGGDLADFNNDGYLDLVTPSYSDNSIAISVNLNNGNGTFAAKTDYAGGRMMDARTGDFDGDGDIDIISVSQLSGTYSVFINSGNGTFAAAVNYTAVGGPDLVLVRDFNGDGKLDFVASVFGTGTVAVYMGNGNGTFASGVSYTTSVDTATGFDIADVTGDRKEDLVVVSDGGISVLPGNSNGTFGTAITKTTGFGSFMNSANVADINNDGKLDLVAGSLSQLFVYLGTGGGNFANVVNYGTGGSNNYALLYDFDGDGDMDAVGANFNTSGRVYILTNNGAGVFAAHSNYVAGSYALIPKVADVNNDGQKDLIVINQTGDTSVLINSASPMFYAQSSSGNVGMGTNAPGTKLEVVGDIISKGTTWTARTSSSDSGWLGVTYGNGLFVAVADSGTSQVQTSSDGVVWTSRTSASTNGWADVTYGNGLFVAVAFGGLTNRVQTSPDGVNWTGRAAAENNTWRGVAYGNGTFVAVAGSGANRVMTSPDGVTWISRTAAEANSWNDVTYANGLFVAVSTDGTNRVMTSPDGITWTARSAAEANVWNAITYANGLFVAVAGSGTNRVMTSPDGITWTARSATSFSWNGVTYGNGLFVAVTNSGAGNNVMTSPDGITWTSRTSPNQAWQALTYANGIFVAVGVTGTGTRVMTSGKIEQNVLSHNNIYQGGMSILSGNVGIGTATPGTKLHIAGVTTAGGHILPDVDDTYDLGSATMRFRDLYLGPASLHIGDNVLSNTGGSLVWSGTSIGATASATSSTEIKLSELSGSGSNYTGFKSPNALDADVLYTLPSADGTNGQSLTTNGSGGLSWVNSAVGKISTVHHFVGTALAITTTHNNAEIHAESTGGFTIDGAGFTEDTFGATIVNTGGVSVTLTPSNFLGSFLRDGTTDAGFATLSIEPDTAYKLTVTNNGGSKFLNVIKFAAGGSSSQWTTSGANIFFNTGNVAIGTSTPSASAKLLISGAVAAATAGTSENAGLATTGSPTIDTTTATGETIIRWTGTGTFTPPTGVASVQVLVVAGGAGGGSGVSGDVRGGGGGAGGLISDSAFAVTPGTSVTVTVGAGGAAAANGNDSVFDTLTADGGGRGGSGAQTGFAGGSGGGGGAPSGATASFTGGTGTVGEGSDGGTGSTDGTTYRNGGGGGGAGAVGGAGSANGTGGAGTASTITGTSVTYAGGGGGGGPAATNGGTGGGGRGGAYPGGAATAGTANKGGGGGGAANGIAGAAGGSGVVIVRFTTVPAVAGGLASDNALLRVKDTGSVASATLAFFESTSGNGCIISGQTGLACSSDASLKKNVNNLESSLGNILALRPVTYDWNYEGDGGGNHIGFIAQEVEQLFPGLVVSDPNGKKALAYDRFAPILVKSVQELVSEQKFITSRLDQTEAAQNLPTVSPSQLEKLVISGALTVGNLEVLGESIFRNIATFTADANFEKAVVFAGDVTFKGRALFEDRDMAGFAKIALGQDKVVVTYEKEYPQAPVVQISLASVELSDIAYEVNTLIKVCSKDESREACAEKATKDALSFNRGYAVVSSTPKGFTILLENPALYDLNFNWSVIPVKDAKTQINEATPTPSPEVTITPSPTPEIVVKEGEIENETSPAN